MKVRVVVKEYSDHVNLRVEIVKPELRFQSAGRRPLDFTSSSFLSSDWEVEHRPDNLKAKWFAVTTDPVTGNRCIRAIKKSLYDECKEVD